MKYLKNFNESISSEDNIVKLGNDLMSDYIEDIRDFLPDFNRYSYDIRFLLIGSGTKLIMQIIPKGYPDSHRNIESVLIDDDILDDFKGVTNYIYSEVEFIYTHSYYFIDHDYNHIKSDIFDSEGKYVTMLQIYFDLVVNQNSEYVI